MGPVLGFHWPLAMFAAASSVLPEYDPVRPLASATEGDEDLAGEEGLS